jgi:hypothetical protein
MIGADEGERPMSVGKWVVWLLVAMVALAVVGFLVDALRFLAGAAFVVCLGILIFRVVTSGSRQA